MLTDISFTLLIATLLGFLSGLGTGGGSLLILWLTLVEKMPQNEARFLNLLFFLPTALIACLFRCKQGHLQIKKILPAILAGSITAGLCAWFSNQWDMGLLKKLFGVLLLFTGLREIFYKPKE